MRQATEPSCSIRQRTTNSGGEPTVVSCLPHTTETRQLYLLSSFVLVLIGAPSQPSRILMYLVAEMKMAHMHNLFGRMESLKSGPTLFSPESSHRITCRCITLCVLPPGLLLRAPDSSIPQRAVDTLDSRPVPVAPSSNSPKARIDTVNLFFGSAGAGDVTVLSSLGNASKVKGDMRRERWSRTQSGHRWIKVKRHRRIPTRMVHACTVLASVAALTNGLFILPPSYVEKPHPSRLSIFSLIPIFIRAFTHCLGLLGTARTGFYVSRFRLWI